MGNFKYTQTVSQDVTVALKVQTINGSNLPHFIQLMIDLICVQKYVIVKVNHVFMVFLHLMFLTRQLCSTQQESWMKTTFSSLLWLKCSCFLHESVKFSYISLSDIYKVFCCFFTGLCPNLGLWVFFYISTIQYFCSQITDPGLIVFEIFMFEYCFRFQCVKKISGYQKIFDKWSKISTALNI